jgi:methionine sulfoxide reductase heme-binding subunit
MSNKWKVHLVSTVLIVLILLIGNLVSNSTQQQVLIYVSSFGSLALLSVIFILLIPVLTRLKRNNFTVTLLANRRWIGIYTFVFALIHVLLVYNFLFNRDLNKITEAPNRLFLILGIISFIILAVMAATSNNRSVRMLGKNWKRLHLLIYLVLVLVIIHSFNIGLIFMKNIFVKIIIGVVAVLLILGKINYRKVIKKGNTRNKNEV